MAGIREFADRVGGARRGHTHFRDAKRSPKYALPARTSCCSAFSKVTLGRISCTAPDTCVPGKRQIAAGSRRSLVEAYPSLSLVEGGFNLDDRVVDHKRRDGSTLRPGVALSSFHSSPRRSFSSKERVMAFIGCIQRAFIAADIHCRVGASSNSGGRRD